MQHMRVLAVHGTRVPPLLFALHRRCGSGKLARVVAPAVDLLRVPLSSWAARHNVHNLFKGSTPSVQNLISGSRSISLIHPVQYAVPKGLAGVLWSYVMHLMRPKGASARKQHCCGAEHEQLLFKTSCSHLISTAGGRSEEVARKLQAVCCQSIMHACKAARQACAACMRGSLGCAALPAHKAVTKRLLQLRSTPARWPRMCVTGPRARRRHPRTTGVDSRKKTHRSIALACTASYRGAMAP